MTRKNSWNPLKKKKLTRKKLVHWLKYLLYFTNSSWHFRKRISSRNDRLFSFIFFHISYSYNLFIVQHVSKLNRFSIHWPLRFTTNAEVRASPKVMHHNSQHRLLLKIRGKKNSIHNCAIVLVKSNVKLTKYEEAKRDQNTRPYKFQETFASINWENWLQ